MIAILNLLKYWKYGVLGIGFLLISGLVYQISEKNDEIENLSLQLEVKKIQTDSFIAAIDNQNSKIQELLKEGEEQAAQIRESQEQVIKLDQEVRIKTSQILSEKVGKSCAETMSWMVKKAEKL